jgi:hypothetical protein
MRGGAFGWGGRGWGRVGGRGGAGGGAGRGGAGWGGVGRGRAAASRGAPLTTPSSKRQAPVDVLNALPVRAPRGSGAHAAVAAAAAAAPRRGAPPAAAAAAAGATRPSAAGGAAAAAGRASSSSTHSAGSGATSRGAWRRVPRPRSRPPPRDRRSTRSAPIARPYVDPHAIRSRIGPAVGAGEASCDNTPRRVVRGALVVVGRANGRWRRVGGGEKKRPQPARAGSSGSTAPRAAGKRRARTRGCLRRAGRTPGSVGAPGRGGHAPGGQEPPPRSNWEARVPGGLGLLDTPCPLPLGGGGVGVGSGVGLGVRVWGQGDGASMPLRTDEAIGRPARSRQLGRARLRARAPSPGAPRLAPRAASWVPPRGRRAPGAAARAPRGAPQRPTPRQGPRWRRQMPNAAVLRAGARGGRARSLRNPAPAPRALCRAPAARRAAHVTLRAADARPHRRKEIPGKPVI